MVNYDFINLGRFTYIGGDSYEGKWVNNEREGRGKFYN